ncbi:TPA: hypothetical protein DIC21_00255 [Candidatus Uhrbacteria bacterium]|nr:hypothetical protein [Candidatus Uhrbacteria bacterium]
MLDGVGRVPPGVVHIRVKSFADLVLGAKERRVPLGGARRACSSNRTPSGVEDRDFSLPLAGGTAVLVPLLPITIAPAIHEVDGYIAEPVAFWTDLDGGPEAGRRVLGVVGLD